MERAAGRGGSNEGSLSELEALIGYTFQDIKHLETAITHKSFVNEKMVGRYMSYERYEFLGDAILEFIVSKYLFENYQTMPEGDLSKLRSSLVCEFTLSKISRDLRFGEFARFSKGERQTGGANRDSILCDMFESVLGAIYLAPCRVKMTMPDESLFALALLILLYYNLKRITSSRVNL